MIWSRWSGAGNTFFISDAWNHSWRLGPDQRSQYAKKICNALPNAPTDGLLFLEKSSEYDFQWDFYNADGSGAEMCGNAARCAAQYFNQNVKVQKNVSFLTSAGEIKSEIIAENTVEVLMPPVQVRVPETNENFFVNTGVPHWVLQEIPNKQRALELRPYPKPQGANVTFVTHLTAHGCEAVSFERGVENFTQACGTGAVAAAAFLANGGASGPFSIQMPGGILKIENLGSNQRPVMTGPVEKNFDFEWSE